MGQETKINMSRLLLYLCKVFGLRMICCSEGGQSRPELQSRLGLSDLDHIVLAESCSCLVYPGWSITTFYTRLTQNTTL